MTSCLQSSSVLETPNQKNNQGIAYKPSDKGRDRGTIFPILISQINGASFKNRCSDSRHVDRLFGFNEKTRNDCGKYRYQKGNGIDVTHNRHNQNLNEKHDHFLSGQSFHKGGKTKEDIAPECGPNNHRNYSHNYEPQPNQKLHDCPPNFTTQNRGPFSENLVNSSAFSGPRPLKTRGVLAGRNHVNRPTRKPIRGVTYPVAGHQAGRRAGLCPNRGSGAPTLTPTEENSGAWGSLRLAAASCRSPLGQRLAVPLPTLGVH